MRSTLWGERYFRNFGLASGKVHDLVDVIVHPHSQRHGRGRAVFLTLLAGGRTITTTEQIGGGRGKERWAEQRGRGQR